MTPTPAMRQDANQFIDYKQLAQALLAQQGGGMGTATKAVATTPSYQYGYTQGGIFAQPGLEKPVFSTFLMPELGLQSMLPVVANNEMNPLYGIITGVNPTTGTPPNGVCDDPETVGLSTLCTQSAYFGRWSLQSPVLDITQIGKIPNRGVMTDLQIMNQPEYSGNPLLPSAPGQATEQSIVKAEINKLLFEFGVSWARRFGRKLYTGNPANNTAGGGYKEFYGVDAQVNTGHKDAINGTLCPAVDSLVYAFNANVSGAANAANAAALINRIVYFFRNLRFMAKRAQLDPVNWVLCLPDQLFYEITAFWPCNYLTNQCQTAIGSTSTNVQIQVNGSDVVAMRDEMRNERFLWIDGMKVPVVIDEAITVSTSDNITYSSSIYFIPLTVLGRYPVTFLEYFNYDMGGGSIAAAQILAPNGFYYTSDSGRFLWTKKAPSLWCTQFAAIMEPRLKMLTPYLAARITGISYTPLMVTRSAWPGDPNYVQGGSLTSPTSWYPTGQLI